MLAALTYSQVLRHFILLLNDNGTMAANLNPFL